MSRFEDSNLDGSNRDGTVDDLPNVDERLADWVDGAMSQRDRDRFEAELRVSPQLRDQLAEYESTVAAIREALGGATESTDLADRVMSSLAQRASGVGRRPRLSWPLLWAISSAAALLAVAILVDSWGASMRAPAHQQDTVSHIDENPAAGKLADGAEEADRPKETGPDGAEWRARSDTAGNDKAGIDKVPAADSLSTPPHQEQPKAHLEDESASLNRLALTREAAEGSAASEFEKAELQASGSDVPKPSTASRERAPPWEGSPGPGAGGNPTPGSPAAGGGRRGSASPMRPRSASPTTAGPAGPSVPFAPSSPKSVGGEPPNESTRRELPLPGDRAETITAAKDGADGPGVPGTSGEFLVLLVEDPARGELLPLVTIDGYASSAQTVEDLRAGAGKAGKSGAKPTTGSDDYYLGAGRRTVTDDLEDFFEVQMRPAPEWLSTSQKSAASEQPLRVQPVVRQHTIGGLQLFAVGPTGVRDAGGDGPSAGLEPTPKSQLERSDSGAAAGRPASAPPAAATREPKSGRSIPGQFEAIGGAREQRDWLVVGPESEVAAMLAALRKHADANRRAWLSGEVRVTQARSQDPAQRPDESQRARAAADATRRVVLRFRVRR